MVMECCRRFVAILRRFAGTFPAIEIVRCDQVEETVDEGLDIQYAYLSQKNVRGEGYSSLSGHPRGSPGHSELTFGVEHTTMAA